MENESIMNVKIGFCSQFDLYGPKLQGLFNYKKENDILYIVDENKSKNNPDYYECIMDTNGEKIFEVRKDSKRELTPEETSIISKKIFESLNDNISKQKKLMNENKQDQRFTIKERRKAVITDFLNILKIAGLPLVLMGLGFSVPDFSLGHVDDVTRQISLAFSGLALTVSLSQAFKWDISVDNTWNENYVLSNQKQRLKVLENQLSFAMQTLNKLYKTEESDLKNIL